ncbi:hypothetical protein CBR_g68712 [Chara braunii]|uniref:DUF4360 domain-containing protein n=1 Tax=Chara braunii TaxID=69332 RepID=A0A388K9J3_CHABU|nr:hypothetical protein CBR_g68712 [Chara braunii]|eukprot:GBG66728.1 hypothetical protein CBR_g68712 [Chara braunii]
MHSLETVAFVDVEVVVEVPAEFDNEDFLPACQEGRRSKTSRLITMAQRGFPPVPSIATMAALLLLAFLQSPIHGQAASPEAGTVKITGFQYAGDGCPPGSAEGAVSDDGQAITVMFSKYTASTDAGLDGLRKKCTVTVNLSYPPGFRYHLGTVTMRGYAKLDAGVTGTAQTSYYISGTTGTARAQRVIAGSFDDNYEFTDKFGVVAYSQCNVVRDLNLNSEVRLNPGKPAKSGLMTVDAQDLKLTQEFAIIWESC